MKFNTTTFDLRDFNENATFDYSETCYKIIKANRCHNNFIYQHGLNRDIYPLSKFDYEPGGLCFTDRAHVANYLSYGDYVCRVYIPIGCPVHHSERKGEWKTYELFVDWDNRMLLNQFSWTIEDILLSNGFVINYIENPSIEMCVAAVKQNPFILQYLKRNLTHEICFAAVQKSAFAILYIPNEYWANETNYWINEIYWAAMKQNGFSDQYIPSGCRKNKICKADQEQQQKELD